MSDDLISRKELADKYCNFAVVYISDECIRDSILDIIESMPTAFDKEKVDEELKGEIELVVHNPMMAGRYIKKNRAIEIVEKGGIA